MGLFKKKKAPEPEPIKIKTPCEMFGHLWQDFPWDEEYGRELAYQREGEVLSLFLQICQ